MKHFLNCLCPSVSPLNHINQVGLTNHSRLSGGGRPLFPVIHINMWKQIVLWQQFHSNSKGALHFFKKRIKTQQKLYAPSLVIHFQTCKTQPPQIQVTIALGNLSECVLYTIHLILPKTLMCKNLWRSFKKKKVNLKNSKFPNLETVFLDSVPYI